MKRYDPLQAPIPAQWLALNETQRLELVERYHSELKIPLRNVGGHAAAHTSVETQLAEAYAPATRALTRLLNEGLDRHQAVHAIGSVLMEHQWNLANKPRRPGDVDAPYVTALDALNVESWLRPKDK
jgi:hypothetical protein